MSNTNSTPELCHFQTDRSPSLAGPHTGLRGKRRAEIHWRRGESCSQFSTCWLTALATQVTGYTILKRDLGSHNFKDVTTHAVPESLNDCMAQYFPPSPEFGCSWKTHPRSRIMLLLFCLSLFTPVLQLLSVLICHQLPSNEGDLWLLPTLTYGFSKVLNNNNNGNNTDTRHSTSLVASNLMLIQKWIILKFK